MYENPPNFGHYDPLGKEAMDQYWMSKSKNGVIISSFFQAWMSQVKKFPTDPSTKDNFWISQIKGI